MNKQSHGAEDPQVLMPERGLAFTSIPTTEVESDRTALDVSTGLTKGTREARAKIIVSLSCTMMEVMGAKAGP